MLDRCSDKFLGLPAGRPGVISDKNGGGSGNFDQTFMGIIRGPATVQACGTAEFTLGKSSTKGPIPERGLSNNASAWIAVTVPTS